MYCTYLTTYHGNKLPPFYIGYSSTKKVNNGYHGSVSSQEYRDIWEQELKEHPKLFKTQILKTYASKKGAINSEITFQKFLKVIKNPLYVNKAIGQEFSNEGNKHSETTKEKISLSRKAYLNKNPIFPKGHPKGMLGRKHSEATKEKIRLKMMGNLN